MNSNITRGASLRGLLIPVLLFNLLLGIFIARAQQPTFLTNGLVAYYPFNGDAKDASGNKNDGTPNSVKKAPDRFGSPDSAYLFSGLGSTISVPHSKSIALVGDLTISVWKKAGKPTANYENYITKRDSSGNWNYHLGGSFYFGPAGCPGEKNKYISARRSNNGAQYDLRFTDVTVSESFDRWIHLVVVINKNRITFFTDGIPTGYSCYGSEFTAPAIDVGAPLTIGTFEGDAFNGLLDDIRLYNRALSDSEVKTLHEYEAAPPDKSFVTNGLVAYLPFNGDAKDASGFGNHGTVSTTTLTSDRFGRANSAYNIKGDIGSKITVPNSPSLQFDTQFSVSIWVRFNEPWHFHVEDLIWKSSGAWPDYTGWEISVNQDQAYVPAFTLLNPAKNFRGVSFDVGNFPTTWIQKWRHVVAVRSGAASTLYIDGEAVATGDNGGISVKSPADLIIGGSINPVSGAYNRDVDDVRLYNRDLSAGEVRALFAIESGVQFDSPRNANAIAQVVNGFVVGAIITDGGSGYTRVPKVLVSGGGGSGATAVATIDSNGAVTSIKLLTSGAGYTGTPNIVIDPPPFPPSQAKGTASLVNGFVTGVTIVDTGHGYEGVIPPVTFLGGGGNGAKGEAIVSNGVVTGISMTASGAGYTNSPYVLIAAPPGLPTSTIEVSQVRVNLSLIPGYTYKIQTSTDGGNTWVDIELGILAVDKTLLKIFDVISSTQLFRVLQVN